MKKPIVTKVDFISQRMDTIMGVVTPMSLVCVFIFMIIFGIWSSLIPILIVLCCIVYFICKTHIIKNEFRSKAGFLTLGVRPTTTPKKIYFWKSNDTIIPDEDIFMNSKLGFGKSRRGVYVYVGVLDDGTAVIKNTDGGVYRIGTTALQYFKNPSAENRKNGSLMENVKNSEMMKMIQDFQEKVFDETQDMDAQVKQCVRDASHQLDKAFEEVEPTRRQKCEDSMNGPYMEDKNGTVVRYVHLYNRTTKGDNKEEI